jgi:hypothetical protein
VREADAIIENIKEAHKLELEVINSNYETQ